MNIDGNMNNMIPLKYYTNIQSSICTKSFKHFHDNNGNLIELLT